MQSMTLHFDPSVPEFITSPYPTFAALREQDPVHWSSKRHEWMPSRYAEVKQVLSDPRFGAPPLHEHTIITTDPATHNDPLRELHHLAERAIGQWLINRDPPDHTRLRAQLRPAFSKNSVKAWRPMIRARVDELLDRIQPAGEFDVMSDFADDLPFTLICEMMAVPVPDRPALRTWTRDLLGLLGFNRTPATRGRGSIGMLKAQEYFDRLGKQRLREPGDDLFSRLVLASAVEHDLSWDEVTANAVMLVVGGDANVGAVIANGLIALEQHPAQRELLRTHPEYTRQAVEEILRYDISVQLASRVALEDVRLDGKIVRRGESIRALLGAANRDPDYFKQPDRLDIARAPNLHVSFGAGIHYCLGAHLARLQLEIAFSAILERMPHYEIVPGPLKWRHNFMPRTVHSLPVRF